MGEDFPHTPWPYCGEIDIMENFGPANNDSKTNHATIHGPGYTGTGVTTAFEAPHELSAQYFVYALEWAPDSLKFYLNGQQYASYLPTSLPFGAGWVFNNRPFFLVLNVAVGGFPAPVGYPDSSTKFPQEMSVAYIRVYQHEY
jgi:beta-glucanase (GH16 family)